MGSSCLLNLKISLLFHTLFEKLNVLTESQIEEVCHVMAMDVKGLVCSLKFEVNVSVNV